MVSKYRNTGQICVCANRVYVQRDVLEVFTQKLVAEVNPAPCRRLIALRVARSGTHQIELQRKITERTLCDSPDNKLQIFPDMLLPGKRVQPVSCISAPRCNWFSRRIRP